MININVTEKLLILFITIWILGYLIDYLGEENCKRWRTTGLADVTVGPSNPRRTEVYKCIISTKHVTIYKTMCVETYMSTHIHLWLQKLCVQHSLDTVLKRHMVPINCFNHKAFKIKFHFGFKRNPLKPSHLSSWQRAQSYKVLSMMLAHSKHSGHDRCYYHNTFHLSHNPNLSNITFSKFYLLSFHCARSCPLQC